MDEDRRKRRVTRLLEQWNWEEEARRSRYRGKDDVQVVKLDLNFNSCAQRRLI